MATSTVEIQSVSDLLKKIPGLTPKQKKRFCQELVEEVRLVLIGWFMTFGEYGADHIMISQEIGCCHQTTWNLLEGVTMYPQWTTIELHVMAFEMLCKEIQEIEGFRYETSPKIDIRSLQDSLLMKYETLAGIGKKR